MSRGRSVRPGRQRQDATPAALLTLLQDRYGAPGVLGLTLRLLSREAGKGIYRVSASAAADGGTTATDGPGLPWVARVYQPWQHPEGLRAQADMLRLLEQRGYPAPRVVPALDGSLVTALASDGHPDAADDAGGSDQQESSGDGDDPDGPDTPADRGAPAAGQRPVVVTTYVAGRMTGLSLPGRMTGLSLPGLRAHAAAVGHLHALAPPKDPIAAGLRPADMLPRNELAAAQSWLTAVRERVPPGLRSPYDELEVACHTLSRFEDGPRVLLHNDCHPWNSVREPSGRVVLIDWEVTGLGPAAIDLDFVALSADTGGLVGPVIAPDAARLDALLEGYAAHHRPPAAELDHLADAVRFRTLVAACTSFARCVARQTAQTPWGWQRYLAAEAIAGRIRARLEASASG